MLKVTKAATVIGACIYISLGVTNDFFFPSETLQKKTPGYKFYIRVNDVNDKCSPYDQGIVLQKLKDSNIDKSDYINKILNTDYSLIPTNIPDIKDTDYYQFDMFCRTIRDKQKMIDGLVNIYDMKSIVTDYVFDVYTGKISKSENQTLITFVEKIHNNENSVVTTEEKKSFLDLAFPGGADIITLSNYYKKHLSNVCDKKEKTLKTVDSMLKLLEVVRNVAKYQETPSTKKFLDEIKEEACKITSQLKDETDDAEIDKFIKEASGIMKNLKNNLPLTYSSSKLDDIVSASEDPGGYTYLYHVWAFLVGGIVPATGIYAVNSCSRRIRSC